MSAQTVEKNITSDLASWITQNLPSSFAELRKDALAEFEKLGLPEHKTEEFKFTPITRELEKNFDFKVKNTKGKSDVSPFLINGINGDTLVFINGVFSKEKSLIQETSGVAILSMEEAVSKYPELVLENLGKLADYKTNGLVAWNTSSWTSGVFIHVEENAIIERPVLMHYISDTENGQSITVARNLILVDKNAAVSIVEKFDSLGSANHFTNILTEGIVDSQGELNLYSIQNNSGNQYQYNHKQIQQSDNSRVNTFTFTLNGKLVRNNLHLSLDGEGIESHMYGLYLLAGNTLADNHTVVDHKKPNSFSNELYKGVMDESSKGVFNGKIYVRPHAQKTNAFQTNRNILLTDKATVNTKPQLEIWADDVKCSHGCTSGQLDEEALFYLQSRGIKKDTAQAMMLYAFAGEVLQYVKHPVLKEYLDIIISERLHKNF